MSGDQAQFQPRSRMFSELDFVVMHDSRAKYAQQEKPITPISTDSFVSVRSLPEYKPYVSIEKKIRIFNTSEQKKVIN